MKKKLLAALRVQVTWLIVDFFAIPVALVWSWALGISLVPVTQNRLAAFFVTALVIRLYVIVRDRLHRVPTDTADALYHRVDPGYKGESPPPLPVNYNGRSVYSFCCNALTACRTSGNTPEIFKLSPGDYTNLWNHFRCSDGIAEQADARGIRPGEDCFHIGGVPLDMCNAESHLVSRQGFCYYILSGDVRRIDASLKDRGEKSPNGEG